MKSKLPELGIGISFRTSFASELFLHKEKIDFLEIIADHYLDCPKSKWDELLLLKDHFVLIPHAINLSLGSADGLNARYTDKLAALVSFLNPPWWSEHISFSKIGEVEIGHLSPMPFTQEALETLSSNIQTIQKKIDTPLILENISYLVNLPENEMTEATFINELLSKNNCGLLLDLTNLYYNSQNSSFDPYAYIETLPLEKIVQFHFTGGISRSKKLIDNHSTPTPPEVWELMKFMKSKLSIKGAILERDDQHPPFHELLSDIEIARKIL